MAEARSSELPLAQSHELAVKLREELARRHMSRQQLADLARISISTLEKALNGSRPFTLATLVRLEAALDMPLRPSRPDITSTGAAAEALGAYTFEAVKWLAGEYLTLRPSFEVQDAIFAYVTSIRWDSALGCLVFQESGRQDLPFTQTGVVSVPNKSGHIYLHTNNDGQFRLAVLGRPLFGGEMYGLLTTLQAGAGTQLLPVSVALALLPYDDTHVLGRITPDAEGYTIYRSHLTKVIEKGFARLLSI